MAANDHSLIVGSLSTQNQAVVKFVQTLNYQAGEHDYSSAIVCLKKLQSDINKYLTEIIDQKKNKSTVTVESVNIETEEEG